MLFEQPKVADTTLPKHLFVLYFFGAINGVGSAFIRQRSGVITIPYLRGNVPLSADVPHDRNDLIATASEGRPFLIQRFFRACFAAKVTSPFSILASSVGIAIPS